MSDKNQSGKNAQLSLLDILGLAGDIEGKYSSDEIEKVIGKLRAAKRIAEKQEENDRRRSGNKTNGSFCKEYVRCTD